MRFFEGAEPKIGGILGFKAERIDKKNTYEKFKEKLINYVGREFKNADDILPMLREGINPQTDFETKHLPKPLSTADANNEIKKALLKERIKMYIARESQLEENVTKLYNIIWGQCTDQLQSAIKYQSDYEKKSKEKDVLWLLKKLQKETAGLDSLGNKHVNLIKALKAMLDLQQGETEGNDNYVRRLKASVEALNLAGGGHIMISPDLIVKATDPATDEEKAKEREKFMAALVIMNSDKKRFDPLKQELINASYVGRNDYPTSTSTAHDLLARRSGRYETVGRRTPFKRGMGRANVGRSYEFLQVPEGCKLIPGSDGETKPVQCYNCKEWGLFSYNCPSSTASKQGKNGTSLMQHSTSPASMIPKNWVLLDTCSTTSVSNNKYLLKNLKNVTLMNNSRCTQTVDTNVLIK